MCPRIPTATFICQKAKMFKPPSRTVGGSTHVEAEKFGDHITADFIVTRDEDELGIDDEKSALVVKDIATGFMYVYTNVRRTTNANAAILAIKHFVGHTEESGVFYSDNAPELIPAMKILQCRHVLSRDYIPKSDAQAERAVRSVLEGTPSEPTSSGSEPLALATCCPTLVLPAELSGNGGQPITLGTQIWINVRRTSYPSRMHCWLLEWSWS